MENAPHTWHIKKDTISVGISICATPTPSQATAINEHSLKPRRNSGPSKASSQCTWRSQLLFITCAMILFQLRLHFVLKMENISWTNLLTHFTYLIQKSSTCVSPCMMHGNLTNQNSHVMFTWWVGSFTF